MRICIDNGILTTATQPIFPCLQFTTLSDNSEQFVNICYDTAWGAMLKIKIANCALLLCIVRDYCV
ncbi:MAG: hypothetical protein JWP94_901 [Mucilaginibacter sp.]|jgi:hypothetical protein|nr:hypothetical protein [Mucilaginibacter sp.]